MLENGSFQFFSKAKDSRQKSPHTILRERKGRNTCVFNIFLSDLTIENNLKDYLMECIKSENVIQEEFHETAVDVLLFFIQEAKNVRKAGEPFPYNIMGDMMAETVFTMNDEAYLLLLNNDSHLRTEHPDFYEMLCWGKEQQVEFITQLAVFCYKQIVVLWSMERSALLLCFTATEALSIMKTRIMMHDEIYKLKSVNAFVKSLEQRFIKQRHKNTLNKIVQNKLSEQEQKDAEQETNDNDIPVVTDHRQVQYENFLRCWTPKKIIHYLDQYITKQDEAKKELAYLCYEHMVRIVHPEKMIKKNNYVMHGPTGCGKTELARLLKKIMPVPVEIVDISSVTMSGFQGMEKEDLLFALKQNNPDIEHGIVFLDEFDKICTPVMNRGGRNVNQTLQGELLKMIEGTTLYKEVKADGKRTSSSINTEQITFVCCGAFIGAFEPAKEKAQIGFMHGDEANADESKSLVSECLINFGMIPELAGRICTEISLSDLDETDLLDIITNRKNNYLENMQVLYKTAYNKELCVTQSAMEEICKQAHSLKVGARALRNVLEKVCHDKLMEEYDNENPVITITEDIVKASIA